MTEPFSPPIPVALAACPSYEPAALTRHVGDLLTSLSYHPARGERVLVKPNLLRSDALSCSQPELVQAACLYLLDHGCVVTVGDSPGFGSGPGVARHIGLADALSGLPGGALPVKSLDSPVFLPLTLGGSVGISRYALEADSILNLPRLKAHSQMRITCGVKNLFGCVSGLRKALLHARHGDKGREFPSLITDITAALPPAFTLVDAVTAMHVTGPSGGKPFAAGLLAASPSPVAVDTIIYGLLRLTPEDLAIWRELRLRKTPGAFAEDIALLGAAPETFSFAGFQTPLTLKNETFDPRTLLRSTIKRIWARLRS